MRAALSMLRPSVDASTGRRDERMGEMRLRNAVKTTQSMCSGLTAGILAGTLALGASLAGCADEEVQAPTENQVSGQTSEIIGGIDARGKKYDAVGTIGFYDDFFGYEFICSATLIDPQTVLTAKHC